MSLIVQDVSKHYGQKLAVNSIQFELSKPCIFGLLGTNGAGKTTTIRMVLGIISRDSGVITWNGQPISQQMPGFGYLAEERGLYPRVSVATQLIYFAQLRGLSRVKAAERLDYWLNRLEATEYRDMNVEKLSKGNQQKIQFIAAIIHGPDLIFLDEPFFGLDPVNTELFKTVIRELNEEGKYIVLSAHVMQTIEEFAHDILILKNGDTVLQGNLAEIKHSYGRSNLIISCDNDILPLTEGENIRRIGKTARGEEFKIADDSQAYRILQKILDANYVLNRFELCEPSLNEIFIEKVSD